MKIGESFDAAARALGCSVASLQRVMKETGGVLSRVGQRSKLRLSVQECEEISRRLVEGRSLRDIARTIARAPSTVSRDVNAAGGREGYRVCLAEQCAEAQARRPEPFRIAVANALRDRVEADLAQSWSRQQVFARLAENFAEEKTVRISHETFYKSLFVQGRGALRKELIECRRTGRAQRRRTKILHPMGRFRDMAMISERPADVADRAFPGYWEGDLGNGRKGLSAVATLAQRRGRNLMHLPLPHDRTADRVRDALTKKACMLPDHLRVSQTWGHGKEMADYARFAVDSKVDV